MNNKKISKQKLLGILGEFYCETILSKTMDSYTRADKLNFIGTSYLHESCHNDFDYTNMPSVITRCQDSGYCEIEDDIKPCLTKDFLKPNYDATDYIDYPDTGDNKFRPYCSVRHTKVEVDHYKFNTLSGSDKFVRDHLLCNTFIENLYSIDSKANDYNTMEPEERKVHHKYWNGHPGRLDFFAKKDSRFFAIDSKVNTSKLNLWQQVRLSWLQKCGYSAQIYNVIIDTKNIEKLIQTYLKEGIKTTLEEANPSLKILDHEPKKNPHAESLISDMEKVINIAKSSFIWFTPPGKFYW